MGSINEVEILMVEDNITDAELALRALKKRNLANNVFVVKDGAEALEFIFGTGVYAERDVNHTPKVILLDLNLPKVDGLGVLRRIKSDERTKLIPQDLFVGNRYRIYNKNGRRCLRHSPAAFTQPEKDIKLQDLTLDIQLLFNGICCYADYHRPHSFSNILFIPDKLLLAFCPEVK
jgi:CheY-like chemotaxis protein